jgi:hypothetical protein
MNQKKAVEDHDNGLIYVAFPETDRRDKRKECTILGFPSCDYKERCLLGY